MQGLAAFLWREGGRHNAIGAGLILGGALGNYIDRLRFDEGVVDFLLFHFLIKWIFYFQCCRCGHNARCDLAVC